jgi:hypothetical protein
VLFSHDGLAVLAYDVFGRCTGESGFYMAPMGAVRGDLTVYGIGATWPNCIIDFD